MTAIKQQIRGLKKQRDEMLATSYDRAAIARLRRKIKARKRRTRKLAALAKTLAAATPAAAAPAA